jgi:uncharacterized membrane protein
MNIGTVLAMYILLIFFFKDSLTMLYCTMGTRTGTYLTKC